MTLVLMPECCCVWVVSNMWTISKLALSFIHTYTHTETSTDLVENVQREEVGCPSSCDLGQREAGMGGFSALCLFEAAAITAVSGPYLYTDTEQTR